MLSLAISKLQTHIQMHANKEGLIEGLRCTQEERGGERNREKNNQFRECYVLQEGIIIKV